MMEWTTRRTARTHRRGLRARVRWRPRLDRCLRKATSMSGARSNRSVATLLPTSSSGSVRNPSASPRPRRHPLLDRGTHLSGSPMEKRKSNRVSQRIPCSVETAEGRTVGIVRDLSTTGLFVQTRAQPAPNTTLEVCFDADESHSVDAPSFRLEFGVARQRMAPRHLQALMPTGLGLEVIPPADAFRDWLDHHLRTIVAASHAASTREGPPPNACPRTYRFRMVRRDTGASRILMIRAASEATARAQALGRIGAGWKISEVSAS